ncbi:MAG: hypothetical protein AB7S75_08195 [Desulfococcaceae bacterium]
MAACGRRGGLFTKSLLKKIMLR